METTTSSMAVTVGSVEGGGGTPTQQRWEPKVNTFCFVLHSGCLGWRMSAKPMVFCAHARIVPVFCVLKERNGKCCMTKAPYTHAQYTPTTPSLLGIQFIVDILNYCHCHLTLNLFVFPYFIGFPFIPGRFDSSYIYHRLTFVVDVPQWEKHYQCLLLASVVVCVHHISHYVNTWYFVCVRFVSMYWDLCLSTSTPVVSM